MTFDRLPPAAVEKVKIAFLDLLSCVYESLDLSPSLQAIELARRAQGDVPVIGTAVRTAPPQAAFANAVLGHGLVREDMHTGSVSHLGVVVFPALLALAHSRKVIGRDFITAAVCGYEAGAAVGRALMDRETVRLHRPTGITGPLGAAVAGARLLGLSEDASTSALGFAANATGGLNEWPSSGADEMFFHVGFAARNAVTAVELAEMGAFASEAALEGEAGLFAALGRSDRAAQVRLFSDDPEILSVYHKPAPACNYAQTACQVARVLVAEEEIEPDAIDAITVRVSAAALGYPGCNAPGPFERVLQAKMSIQYCVAATLLTRRIEEANYRLLRDPRVLRLIGRIELQEGEEFTRAYPGAQGTEIILRLQNGRIMRRRMDDVTPADPAAIRARFRAVCPNGGEIEAVVDSLEKQPDAAILTQLTEKREYASGRR